MAKAGKPGKPEKPEGQIRVSAPEPEPQDAMEAIRQATAGRERRGGQGPAEFRSECAVCGAKINYAFARRASIPGVCGKCHDDVRREMREELTQEILGGRSPRSSSRIVHYFPRRVFGQALFLGAVLGFAGAVLTALYAPEAFAILLDRSRAGLAQCAAWAKAGWAWARGLAG